MNNSRCGETCSSSSTSRPLRRPGARSSPVLVASRKTCRTSTSSRNVAKDVTFSKNSVNDFSRHAHYIAQKPLLSLSQRRRTQIVISSDTWGWNRVGFASSVSALRTCTLKGHSRRRRTCLNALESKPAANRNVVIGKGSLSDDMSSGGALAATRMLYSLVMYGGMALVSKVICDTSDLDLLASFELDAVDFFNAILFALPPIFMCLVLRQDSVVSMWRPAKVICKVEDEEVREFYQGLKFWQYSLISAAGAICEELFFRGTVQRGIVHALQQQQQQQHSVIVGSLTEHSERGITILTESIHSFSPCAHALASVLTAGITGSMFYLMATPRGGRDFSTTVVLSTQTARPEIRKKVVAWKEDEMLRQIYPPLSESILSLYLSFEWMTTGNLMAPIVTHVLYYFITLRAAIQRNEATESKGRTTL